MKNETLIKLCRKVLLDLLSQCNEYQQSIFKRMYSPKDLSKPIEKVVGGMDPEKIDWAVTQVENTLKKKSTP